MNINQMSESKYLKKEDCVPPITVTISGIDKANMARDNEPAEWKYILHFSQAVKPMVLNMTNARMIAHLTNSEETDEWVGKPITLWNDPTVSFGGHQGGIRVQMPAAAPQSENPAEGMDSAPF